MRIRKPDLVNGYPATVCKVSGCSVSGYFVSGYPRSCMLPVRVNVRDAVAVISLTVIPLVVGDWTRSNEMGLSE